MDSTTANGLFALAGVVIGVVPGTVVPLIDRALARRDAERLRVQVARDRKAQVYRDFLATADGVAVLARSMVNMQAKWSAKVAGARRELDPEEVVLLADARQAGSHALLVADVYAEAAIEVLLAALPVGLESPGRSEVAAIDSARDAALRAMRADLGSEAG
jgi:hypothetical protein